MKRRNNQRGSALLEFAFTGVPLIFIWVSTVQMAIGMWQYDSLQYSVKQVGNFLANHGSDCGGTNSCTTSIQGLAGQMKTYAFAVPPSSIYMTFNSVASDHKTVSTAVSCLLTNSTTPSSGCDQNTTAWPPSSNNTPGSDFEIQAAFQWSPLMGIVAPGSGVSFTFGKFWMPAYTHQQIVF